MKKSYIYADNASTTKLDEEIFEIMKEYFIEEYANPSSIYSMSKKSKQAIKNSREIIARCINADPDEIFFTSSGSESNNWALKCFINDNKKTVLTTNIEHKSVLNCVDFLNKNKQKVEYLPVDNNGLLQIDTLKSYITNNVGLVSVMYANNELGVIQPIKKFAELSHENNALFHTDAVQVAGHKNIDVRELSVDFLSASAHKFCGPKGIGFLYKKNNVEINNLIHGGNQENNMRAGTESVALIVGMANALKKCVNQINDTNKYLDNLVELFYSKMRETSIDFIINGITEKLSGFISISIKNYSSELILHRLDLLGIIVSAGSSCNSHEKGISYVLDAINVSKEYSNGTLRITFNSNNSISDVIYIVNCLEKICV